MKALRIEPADNVAVVAQDTRKGDVLRHAGGEVTALEDIGSGTRSPSKPSRRGGSSASTASPSAGPPRPLPPEPSCTSTILRTSPRSCAGSTSPRSGTGGAHEFATGISPRRRERGHQEHRARRLHRHLREYGRQSYRVEDRGRPADPRARLRGGRAEFPPHHAGPHHVCQASQRVRRPHRGARL